MDVSREAEAGPSGFGSFGLYPRLRELRRGLSCIRLQRQPFEILCMMLERPGEVLTRDEIRLTLWPAGTFVDFEHSLNATIKRLRFALGDSASDPRFIETLSRRGYRFIGALSVEQNGFHRPMTNGSRTVDAAQVRPTGAPEVTVRIARWPPKPCGHAHQTTAQKY